MRGFNFVPVIYLISNLLKINADINEVNYLRSIKYIKNANIDRNFHFNILLSIVISSH